MEQEQSYNKITIRADGSRRVQTMNTEKSMTQQHFAADADANVIVKKYGTTGYWPEPRQGGHYADLTQIPDLQTALQTVKDAEAAFMSLPSEFRQKLGNDPVNMIDYIKDPKNMDECVKYGLINPPPAPAEPVKVEITNPTDTPAVPAG